MGTDKSDDFTLDLNARGGSVAQYGKEIEGVLRHAVREALLMHKRLGNSVAVWRDGQVVLLSPEEILCEVENKS